MVIQNDVFERNFEMLYDCDRFIYISNIICYPKNSTHLNVSRERAKENERERSMNGGGEMNTPKHKNALQQHSLIRFIHSKRTKDGIRFYIINLTKKHFNLHNSQLSSYEPNPYMHFKSTIKFYRGVCVCVCVLNCFELSPSLNALNFDLTREEIQPINLLDWLIVWFNTIEFIYIFVEKKRIHTVLTLNAFWNSQRNSLNVFQ